VRPHVIEKRRTVAVYILPQSRKADGGGHKKQLLRSSRRNVSPVELIDGPFLMRHEHVAGTLVERREIAQTSSGANGVLHHPPEAFNRVEVVPAMGW